jgi:gluconolactonase
MTVRRSRLLCLTILLTTTLGIVLSSDSSRLRAADRAAVYVSAGGDKKLLRYELDLQNGKLKPREEITLPGSPGPQCLHPDGTKLYVSVRSDSSVAVFRINRLTGTLVHLGRTSIGVNSAYVSTDHTGKWLFNASYGGGKVACHPILPDGTVGPNAASVLETARCAHSILPDRANRFVLVPHTCPNAVYQFRFDSATGVLTPNDPVLVHPAAELQPRHLALHPRLDVIYFDDEKGSSVTAYRYDPENGVVMPFQTVSTLPAGFSEGNSCADIEITADGGFVYASNRGHNSIAGFRTDPVSGKLTSIGQFPTGDTPSSFNLSPDGGWLIAAGQRSHDLTIHRRDATTGHLEKLKTYPTGRGPSWVQIVPLEGDRQALYPLGGDSKPQTGVPQGRIEGPFVWDDSTIYPGTTRKYWLYIPAQYEATKPACLFVVQDGLGRARGWNVPTVLDNLTHKGDVPVMIGLFVDHGVVQAPHENAQPRYNRSFEYDALGDRYARFLIEELIPEVKKSYNISDDPNDRAIGGASSGAICAFTAAWERPDAFRRVLSTIGTFVGLRGGDAYPVLIRKMEPKPIRVFLEDGTNDLDLYGGDWWVANLGMLSALRFAGYDVHHAWGEGGHDSRQAAAVLPNAMRWLWRDYPEPIRAAAAPKRRTEILIPGADWELVSKGHRFVEGPAVNSNGDVFFCDVPSGDIFRISKAGDVSPFVAGGPKVSALMFGRDGLLYACHIGDKRIVRYNAEAEVEVLFEDAPCNDLVVLPGGGYYTDPGSKRVWYFDMKGNRRIADEGVDTPNGLITSADQTLLMVADTTGRFVYSYQIQPDGSLKHRQEYGWLHRGDADRDSGTDGMTMDRTGRLYVATRLGVQVLDQLGRVHLILRKPGSGFLSNVVFGGPKLDTLYATCGDSVYRRKLKATGVVPWQAPIKPPRPGL